ncbi:Protein charlatan [Ooceraea biroi]|uniref:Protein charlatan n=1 Tax=Ooceraea biroi TaxID=2015173 RepID=A0A026X3K6_OOCBI|nr:Protein charlatan [Ooceraea biroi]
MGCGPREVAEHFIELHSARILTDNSRNRHHSPRKDYMQIDLKIEDVILYLERLRERAERVAPPTRRTQETQTVPAALLPVTSSFLLQELPSAPTPHMQQNSGTMATPATASTSTKRYCCPYCPYGTDRRDLFTRHENIHREEKPFQCYVCFKPFNRADHVKKHFMRMHREHTYDLNRIRRPAGSKSLQQDSGNTAAAAAAAAAVVAAATAGTSNQQQPQQQHANYQSNFACSKNYQLQPNTVPSTSNGTSSLSLYQAPTMATPGIMQPSNNCNGGRRVQNGCNSKSHVKGGSRSGSQERKYYCGACPWIGGDNWTLKRHMNTHTKPFACTLCEYKAARAERLSTHVLKVHNKRQCSRCSFLAEDLGELQIHQLHDHRINNTSTPSTSIAQTSPPVSNRLQQTLHPVGGRPPPGPPIFPAPLTAIAPTTTVMPSTSYASDPNGPLSLTSNNSVVDGNWTPPDAILNIEERAFGQKDEGNKENKEDQENEGNQVIQMNEEIQEDQENKENYNTPRKKRRRKQKRPIKVIWNLDGCDSCEQKKPILALGIAQDVISDVTQQDPPHIEEKEITEETTSTEQLTERRSWRKKFRCYLCPKNALARSFGRLIVYCEMRERKRFFSNLVFNKL